MTDAATPEVEEATPPSESVSALARRGSLISMASYGGSQLIRLGSNLILTRLLFEEAFGIMALISSVLTGLHLFSDVGIGPSIVQHARGEDARFQNTAFTIQVVRGVILWLVACALAIPIAEFYGEPELAWFLPVSALSALIGGFQSTRLWTQTRRMALGRIAVIDLFAPLGGILVMLALAYAWRNVWALVLGGVVGELLRVSMSHLVLEGTSNRFAWDRSALHELVSFGRWVFVSTVITFCATQSDRLIFGKLVSLDELGVYQIGLVMASMPVTALVHISGTVLFPAYSRVKNEGGDVAQSFLSTRWPLLLAGGWVLSGLVGGGGAAIELLYDERYYGAGFIVQVLSAGSWFLVLESTITDVLLARGQSFWMAAAGFGNLVGMMILIPLGYVLFGFHGAVMGFAGGSFIQYAVSRYAAIRGGLGGVGQDVGLTLMGALAGIVGFVAVELVRPLTSFEIVPALADFLVVTLCWVPLGGPVILRVLRQRRQQTA